MHYCLNKEIKSTIEKRQENVIEKILRHCGLWKDNIPRSPPKTEKPPPEIYDDLQRISTYSPVLGTFMSVTKYFEQTDASGRRMRYESRSGDRPAPRG